jgi:hypothetical protein
MRDIITKLEELNVEKEQLNEGLGDMAHEAEKDHEVQMARSDCYKSAKYAVSIHKMLKDVSEMEGIDGWVASKLTKAADYLGSVKHYMEGQMMQDVELAVVPVAGDMTDAMTMPQESIAEGRLSMRQLASMDKDKVRQIEAMVGPESKYADMGDYQEALYNAARKLGLVESKIDEGYEKMVANALKDAGISHDGFKDGFLRIDQDDMKDARKAIRDADMDPPKMIAEDSDRLVVTMDNGKTFDITDFKGANDMEKVNSFSDSVKNVYSKNNTPVPNYKIHRGANQIGTSTGFGNPYYKESAEEADKKPDMGALLKALKKKLSDEGGAAGFAPLEKIAKDMGVDLTPAMLKGMSGISMHRDGDYILEDLTELTKAQQDRIDAAPGRTIDDMKPAERDSLKKFVKTKLQDPKTGQYRNQSEPAKQFYDKMGYNKLAKEDTVEEEDVIGDIIASLSKTKERMPMPKSKPSVPMQSKQKMANKMALPKSKPDMSMGQDKTTGDPRGILRQSKFAEWSKK